MNAYTTTSRIQILTDPVKLIVAIMAVIGGRPSIPISVILPMQIRSSYRKRFGENMLFCKGFHLIFTQNNANLLYVPSVRSDSKYVGFNNNVCLIEVGCYYEAFGIQAKTLAKTCGLKLYENRRGFAYGCGFSRRYLPKMVNKLIANKIPIVIIRQTGFDLYKTKERLPDWMIIYSPENNPENA